MKNTNCIYLFLVIGMLLFPTLGVFSQCSGPVGDDVDGNPCCAVPPLCGPLCPPCTRIPLDAGLSALLVAGVAFGAKKLKGKVNL